MINLFEDDLGVKHNRKVFAPFSAKFIERVWERCDKLLIDESDIKLWIVTDDRLTRSYQCLDYTSEAYLTFINFIDPFTVFL